MRFRGPGSSFQDRTSEQVDPELLREAVEELRRRPWYGLGVLTVDILQAVAVPQLGQGFQAGSEDAAERISRSAVSRLSPLFGVEDIWIATAVISRPFIAILPSLLIVRYAEHYPGHSVPASTPGPCSASKRSSASSSSTT